MPITTINARQIDQMSAAMEAGEFEEIDVESSDSRGREPGVTPEDLPGLLKTMIEDAISYAEEEVAGNREEWQTAYRGKSLAGDKDLDQTRSRVVSRDVHDTVHAILPSLLRVFFGSSSVVEYVPMSPEDEESAKQATDYVNHIVLQKDNEAFLLFYSVFKDALIKALSPVKWWWDESFKIEGTEYSGLTQQEFVNLVGDPWIIDIYNYEEIPSQLGQPLISCCVTYKRSTGGRVKLCAVPPEERLINRDARSLDDATLWGHRRDMTISELVSMGFVYEQLVEMSGNTENATNTEKVERYDNQGSLNDKTRSDLDPSQWKVDVVEAYVNVDLDADGIAERYKIWCGGSNWEILEKDDGDLAIDLWDEIPVSEFCPDPEPHMATGHSVAENVTDVQRIKSNLLRGALDSLSRSIFPREEVVESAVNMDDVLNPEIGAVIRAKAPGMIREITTPFMGKECLPLLGYMDELKANRTGISATTLGLNPKSLQSATHDAVENSVTAAQSQLEMVARILAQTGMTRLFKGILKCITQNQDKVSMVRLRNNWAPIDPRAWNAGMDAIVTTALGRGTEGSKMAMLNAIAERQWTAITVLGQQNPICTLAEYRETCAEMVGLTGYFNPDRFFLPVQTSQQLQQFFQQFQQGQQQLQQLQQQVGMLSAELNKRSQAAANKDLATAGKAQAETTQVIVETAQLAAGANVDPGAAKDEIRAITVGR